MGRDHDDGAADRPGPGPDGAAQVPPRHEVRLPGRMLVEGEDEQACILEVVQGREALFRADASGVRGRRAAAVAYVDIVGRLKGTAVRIGGDAIALSIEAPEPKWARLHRQFALLAAMPDLGREDLRGHRRIVPDAREVRLSLPHDVVAVGRLRDLSRSGAAVETAATADLGDRVALGSTRGRVARLFEGGFAVEFARLLPFELFGPAFDL